MDVQDLLKRIHFNERVEKKDVELLNKLCLSFISNVPFEDLDLFGGRRKVLEWSRFYDDIVSKSRGGICFDLNGLFYWLLTEIGFKVEMLLAFPYQPRLDSYVRMGNHMVLMVTLENGEKWLADVGFGGSSFCFPLNMDPLGEKQVQSNGVYRICVAEDNWYCVDKKVQKIIKIGESSDISDSREEEDKWQKIFRFRLISHKLEEFQEGLDDILSFPEQALMDKFEVIIQNERGKKFLLGKRFVEKEYIDPLTVRVLTDRECCEEELLPLLKEHFGIIPDYELDMSGFVS